MNVGYYTSVKGARDGMTPEISGFSDNFAPIRDLQKVFEPTESLHEFFIDIYLGV